MVFTCLTKEALPLIRYRTHDVAKSSRPCSCGRTMIKMSKPAGRTDDMLIIRGVNVFPSQIESVLLEFSAAAPFFQIVVDRVGALDTLEVNVELTTEAFSDEVRHLEDLGKEIKRNIESMLGIAVKVRLCEPNSLPRFEGKAVRVIDKRKHTD